MAFGTFFSTLQSSNTAALASDGCGGMGVGRALQAQQPCRLACSVEAKERTDAGEGAARAAQTTKSESTGCPALQPGAEENCTQTMVSNRFYAALWRNANEDSRQDLSTGTPQPKMGHSHPSFLLFFLLPLTNQSF